jgi:hypothetical protein
MEPALVLLSTNCVHSIAAKLISEIVAPGNRARRMDSILEQIEVRDGSWIRTLSDIRGDWLMYPGWLTVAGLGVELGKTNSCIERLSPLVVSLINYGVTHSAKRGFHAIDSKP